MEKALVSKEGIGRKLAVGQILDIEIQDAAKSRFLSPLLGVKEGRYLITDPPSLTKHGNLRDQLRDKQELIIRTICEKTTGECLGFKSSIEARLKIPDQLLFIAYPAHAIVHELRSEKRMLVAQPAMVVLNGGELMLQGTLVDLSNGGCRFECETPSDFELRRDDKLDIEFEHPATGAGQRSTTKVCSVRTVNNLISIGMAFDR